VLITLVSLRFQLPHQALAVLYGVDRATVTRAVGEVRPLLAARGFAVPGQPGSGCAPWPMYPPAQGQPARPAGVCVRQA
jgi:Helix-turn-helix of DDE superfamily endonuclease